MRELGAGRFIAHSAGSHPTGEVHPLALETLQEFRVSPEGLRSKGWEEFSRPGAPALDFVFTVCDQAAGEVCPVWPGQPLTAHWGLPDPAAVEGDPAVRRRAFVDTFVAMKRRIELMLSLPIASLDRMAIRKAVTDIGHR